MIDGTLFILGVTTLLFLYFWRYGGKRYPPGPRTWPLIGSLLDVHPNILHHDLMRWQETYGDIFTLTLTDQKIVVLSNREFIKDATIVRGEQFGGRPYTFRIGLGTRGSKGILFKQYSNHFKMLKKECVKGLKMYGEGLTRLEEISNTAMQGYLDYIDPQIARNGSISIQLEEDLFRLVSNVITSMIFGKAFPWDDPELLKMRENLQDVTNGLIHPSGNMYDIFPFLANIYENEPFRKLRAAQKSLDEFLIKNIDQIAKEFDPNNIKCFVEVMFNHYLNTEYSESEKLLDYDDFIITIKNVFLAGFGTTSTALTNYFLILHHHPEVEKKVIAEIKRVVGSSRFATLADRTEMPYTEASLMELLRFTSHIPISIPHKTLSEVQIGGYTIPKNTQVWLNLWCLHHDERYWDQPFKFKPERFLDPSTGNLIPADHANRLSLMPFGAGRRFCLGETLAKNRMFLFVVNLLQKYQFLLPENTEIPPCDPREHKFGLFINPPTFQMKLVPREEDT